MMRTAQVLLLIGLVFLVPKAFAEESVRIAVAANFLATIKLIAKDFTKQTGIAVHLSNGSTGMLYAQITRGAPYDLFFSADSHRPELLEKAGLIEENSRFTYVTGRLVVWARDPSVSTNLAELHLDQPGFRFFSIANPKIAPYGVAARSVLKHYGLYETLLENHRLALGENIGKTYHYIATGNAQIGLVAKSYMRRPHQGSYVEVDPSLYQPIYQQAVVLKNRNTPAVQSFLKFFHSKAVQEIIKQNGYGLLE